MTLESVFQAQLIKDLKSLFPGCIVMKNDSSYLQGIPDLILLFETHWAFLEVKRDEYAPLRANQAYYVEKAADMSFGAVIFPENKEEILDELQLAFRTRR